MQSRWLYVDAGYLLHINSKQRDWKNVDSIEIDTVMFIFCMFFFKWNDQLFVLLQVIMSVQWKPLISDELDT
jgi:hypothetical protein